MLRRICDLCSNCISDYHTELPDYFKITLCNGNNEINVDVCVSCMEKIKRYINSRGFDPLFDAPNPNEKRGE